jgi:hypothetical protein
MQIGNSRFESNKRTSKLTVNLISGDHCMTNYRLRNSNLLHVPFYKNNYSSTAFFRRALKLANSITDHVDFFLCRVLFFNRNVYLALNLVVN